MRIIKCKKNREKKENEEEASTSIDGNNITNPSKQATNQPTKSKAKQKCLDLIGKQNRILKYNAFEMKIRLYK